MKAKFRFGDLVQVRAVAVAEYVHESKGDSWVGESRREIVSQGLEEPIQGWIVGAAVRREGRLVAAKSFSERGRLISTGSKLVWKVAQSMMNTPIEALDDDVWLVDRAIPSSRCIPIADKHCKPPPMRLGTPWASIPGTPHERLRAEQRVAVGKLKRDARGRWLKES